MNTAEEAATATRIEDVYNAVTAPAVYGVTVTGNHDEYTDVVDDPGVPGLTPNDARNSRAAVAAWFDWQLKGKAEARELRRSEQLRNVELCRCKGDLAREAQEMRDRAFHAVELLDRDLGVLPRLERARILGDLLHQALGRGDRIADLVRDRGRQLLERASPGVDVAAATIGFAVGTLNVACRAQRVYH